METGHNKNVANFEHTITILTELGAEYAPNQELTTLRELQTALAAAKTALANGDTVEAEKTAKVDEVQQEFKDVEKYAVNINRNAEVELNDLRLLLPPFNRSSINFLRPDAKPACPTIY